ncbi:PRA1 family protein A1 [Cryptomeria japonica]|uniref:PRA1 family protein A1 n=1 Tax=Cryptomeria japonica TaxID=3369 RepID=UPI0027D9E376|nr:PRA1 family protein A1 [Cryptomeria japonica]
MDWGSVTVEDLVDALQEVDWTSPPRPLNEFFSRFTVPRSLSKWNSRAKCNLYYYRTNYFIIITFILGLAFVRNPLALLAAILAGFSIALFNDSFAITFNEKVTRTVRQFSPHLAAKLRPPVTPVIRGRSVRRTRMIHICGRPRWMFVLLFSAASTLLWFVSCGILTVIWALLIGLLSTLLHASFRTPNLKARLNTFREEFRAVWRNYSDF